MEELQVAREFLSGVVHLQYAGEALTLCGISTLGLLVRKFFFITEGGKNSCKDCRDTYREELIDEDLM